MSGDPSRLKVKTWWHPWLESWSRREGHGEPDGDGVIKLKGKGGIGLALEEIDLPAVVILSCTVADLIGEEQANFGWVYANEWNLQHSMPTVSVDVDAGHVRMRAVATLPAEAKMFQIQFDQYLTKMGKESKRAFRWVKEACEDADS